MNARTHQSRKARFRHYREATHMQGGDLYLVIPGVGPVGQHSLGSKTPHHGFRSCASYSKRRDWPSRGLGEYSPNSRGCEGGYVEPTYVGKVVQEATRNTNT